MVIYQFTGNYSERQKSSVSFSPYLDHHGPEDNPLTDDKKEIYDKKSFESNSYLFPSKARLSIFSRISEQSFQDLPNSYKY